MSFFDPANMFGGGGSRVRDPLGIFGGGRRQMSPQEIAQAQSGGGQSQRANAFGGGFGGASGYRGQGMRESDFGGPAEMQMPAPQPGGMQGGFSAGLENMDIRDRAAHMRAQQGGAPTWGGGQLGGSPQIGSGAASFGGFSGGKPAPMQGGPNPAAMMQSQAPQQWGQLASALAQQGGPQGMSGGIRRFQNMDVRGSADPYANAQAAFGQTRRSGLGKWADPRG